MCDERCGYACMHVCVVSEGEGPAWSAGVAAPAAAPAAASGGGAATAGPGDTATADTPDAVAGDATRLRRSLMMMIGRGSALTGIAGIGSRELGRLPGMGNVSSSGSGWVSSSGSGWVSRRSQPGAKDGFGGVSARSGSRLGAGLGLALLLVAVLRRLGVGDDMSLAVQWAARLVHWAKRIVNTHGQATSV